MIEAAVIGSVAKRLWPYAAALVAVIAVAIAIMVWGNSRYQSGYDEALQEATAAAALASAAWQSEVTAAETRDIESRAVIATKFRPLRERAANAPSNPDCPDAASRQLLDEAVRASHAASATGPRS